MVDFLTHVPLIKTIYTGFSKAFAKAVYMLWRSDMIKVFATAPTLCSPGTIDLGHSMTGHYCAAKA